jgi:hypothetical protein
MPDRPVVGYVDSCDLSQVRPSVVDVVVLGGAAAASIAGDFGLRRRECRRGDPVADQRRAELIDCAWLAVASQTGTVVGVALARRLAGSDGAGLEVLDLLVSEHADRDHISERLLVALRPLASGQSVRLAPRTASNAILGLLQRINYFDLKKSPRGGPLGGGD